MHRRRLVGSRRHVIHTYATQPHYQHHITHHTQHTNNHHTTTNPQPATPTITASRIDAWTLHTAGYRNIVLIEHGAGQSYVVPDGSGSWRRFDAGNDGRVNPSVRHVWATNQWALDAVAPWTPNADHAIVGAAHVTELATRRATDRDPDPVEQVRPTIGVVLHWPHPVCPESRSSWPWFQIMIARMLTRLPMARVVIIPHPKFPRNQIARSEMVRRHPGIIVDHDWLLWSARVDMMIGDNTSMMWEAAAIGIPTVWCWPPHWRTPARVPPHGLRFPGPNHMPPFREAFEYDNVVAHVEALVHARAASEPDPGDAAYSADVLGHVYPRARHTRDDIRHAIGRL